MASTIVQTGGSKYARLSNSSLGRPLSIAPDQWSILRIGLRCTFEMAAPWPTSGSLAIGLCHGTVPGSFFADATTTNFIGFVSTTWNFMGNGLYTGMKGRTRQGTTDIDSDSAAGTTTSIWNLVATDGSPGYDTVLFVDIYKPTTAGSTAFGIKVWACASTGVPAVSQADFLSCMEALNPVIPGSYSGKAYNMTFSESLGVLDTVNISWDRSTPAFLINDLAISRLG